MEMGVTIKKIKECKKHGSTLYAKKNNRNAWECLKCQYDQSKRYLHSLKEKSLEYKGAKCEICGYKKCKQALCFHHINPDEKSFTIGERKPNMPKSKKWDVIKQELDKCILVCMNCHWEIHEQMEKDKTLE